MLVSVITPLHNASTFISQTIQSVLDQTYQYWEMIIVDDCSTDNSVEIVETFINQDNRIHLYKLAANSGAAAARNFAIEKAKGRFIAFLDSDDMWNPEKLELQISYMLKHGYAFTFGAYDKIDEKGKAIGHIDVPEKVGYADLLKTCSIGCLTAVYDTSVTGKVFMPIINKRQDYGLWLRLLKILPYAHGLNVSLAKYRVRQESLSGNKLKAARYQWKIYREIENLSLVKSAYYFTNYFSHGFFKTYFK
jgi:teichuronic acid biosynthesis glycosyltransferase TuaG